MIVIVGIGFFFKKSNYCAEKATRAYLEVLGSFASCVGLLVLRVGDEVLQILSLPLSSLPAPSSVLLGPLLFPPSLHENGVLEPADLLHEHLDCY